MRASISRASARTILLQFLTRFVYSPGRFTFYSSNFFFRVVVKINANHLSCHSSWYNKHVDAKVSKIILKGNYYC